MNTRILLPTDKESILLFAKQQLQTEIADPMELEMQSWSARWRGEALDHYLPQGWSFGVFAGTRLQGFVLAQPFLFYRGLTQTLWLEHLSSLSPQVSLTLVDTVHRWARDKHFQCVLLEATPQTQFVLETWPQAHVQPNGWIELKSARY